MGTRNFITAINLPLSVRSKSSVDFFSYFSCLATRVDFHSRFPFSGGSLLTQIIGLTQSHEDGEDCERMASTYVLFLYGSDCRMWNKLNNLATSV